MCVVIVANLLEDLKQANGPYCRKYKSGACFFFFLICIWPNPSFSQKRWMMPGHILMLPIVDFVSSYAHFGPVINIISVTGPKCAYLLHAWNVHNRIQSLL